MEVILRAEADLPLAFNVMQMRRSTVVGAGGKSVLDTIRTSRGTFLRCVAVFSECTCVGPRQQVNHAVLIEALIARSQPGRRQLLKAALLGHVWVGQTRLMGAPASSQSLPGPGGDAGGAAAGAVHAHQHQPPGGRPDPALLGRREMCAALFMQRR